MINLPLSKVQLKAMKQGKGKDGSKPSKDSKLHSTLRWPQGPVLPAGNCWSVRMLFLVQLSPQNGPHHAKAEWRSRALLRVKLVLQALFAAKRDTKPSRLLSRCE